MIPPLVPCPHCFIGVTEAAIAGELFAWSDEAPSALALSLQAVELAFLQTPGSGF
jgi:hypothetical protein